MSAERWYVYGIVAGAAAPATLEQGLRLVREDGIAALARVVPADDFDDAHISERLQDPEWVTRLALEHTAVLDRMREHETVLPLRICTVYRSEERLREMLSTEADRLSRVLAHLQGRSEWGVKIFSVRSPIVPESAEADEAQPAGAGAAYLLSRRRERDQIETADRLLDEACDEIHQLLCAAAIEGRANSPQRQELLNGVYLVDDHAAARFGELVSQLGAQYASLGLEPSLTGPWPAYNFVPNHAPAGT